jgi:hypothetical protein
MDELKLTGPLESWKGRTRSERSSCERELILLHLGASLDQLHGLLACGDGGTNLLVTADTRTTDCAVSLSKMELPSRSALFQDLRAAAAAV